MPDSVEIVKEALLARFGERFAVPAGLDGLDELARIAMRRVHRSFLSREVTDDLLQLLCACALSAPSKSDLQQGDILIVRDRAKRERIAAMLPGMSWFREVPVFLVFLANGRRLSQLARMRGKPFANDHFDLLFNATVDAAIVLATFLRAADAVGLGCCPVSLIRDRARELAELLDLPDKVVPVAGLCLGWPAAEGAITPRLSLATTVHRDRFEDADLADQIETYDRRRVAQRPYREQRDVERFGRAEFYGWSEDKARQYSVAQRADFGAFVRAKGFHLD